jgi:hypothetical protein
VQLPSGLTSFAPYDSLSRRVGRSAWGLPLGTNDAESRWQRSCLCWGYPGNSTTKPRRKAVYFGLLGGGRQILLVQSTRNYVAASQAKNMWSCTSTPPHVFHTNLFRWRVMNTFSARHERVCVHWLRHHTTIRKVAGSRPDEINVLIYLILPAVLGPGVYSVSNIN